MARDWVNFPELRNSELPFYTFTSPHEQITDDFRAEVVKVHDGDTITVRWEKRNFDFPVRFLDIDAPEMNTPMGPVSKKWLEQRILGKKVEIEIEPSNRVEKWGRLLGRIRHNGSVIADEMLLLGLAKDFSRRHEGLFPPIDKIFPPLESLF